MLAEQHDEWAEGRRYLGLEVVTRARTTIKTTATAGTDTTHTTEPVLPELEPAA